MEIWQPNAKDGSAVLIFKESSDWGKVKATLGKSTNGHWEPLEASVAKGEPKHFAYMSTLLVCNDEAWQMLKVELKDEVEALPINVDGFLYYILNVINIVDCLDMDRSKFLRLPHMSGVGEIMQYVFEQDKLTGDLLFALPQKPKTIFATSAFKQLVERLQLEDITFQKPASPLEGLTALLKEGYKPPTNE